jgi:hypothetical protein
VVQEIERAAGEHEDPCGAATLIEHVLERCEPLLGAGGALSAGSASSHAASTSAPTSRSRACSSGVAAGRKPLTERRHAGGRNDVDRRVEHHGSVSLSGRRVWDTPTSRVDGSWPYFAGPAFSPALPASDVIQISGATGYSYTIRFGAPVTDPIHLHHDHVHGNPAVHRPRGRHPRPTRLPAPLTQDVALSRWLTHLA